MITATATHEYGPNTVNIEMSEEDVTQFRYTLDTSAAASARVYNAILDAGIGEWPDAIKPIDKPVVTITPGEKVVTGVTVYLSAEEAKHILEVLVEEVQWSSTKGTKSYTARNLYHAIRDAGVTL